MSTFVNAISVILKHEGGYVNNPDDPGGETNFGISMLIIQRENITLEQLGIPDLNTGSLKNMTVAAAQEIYKNLFWDRYDYSRINDQRIATKIFDCGVNCGPKRAHMMAQRAANACAGGLMLGIDGILGPISIAGINSLHPDDFLNEMKLQMEKYYSALPTKNPALKQFMKIWMKRAAWVG